MSLKFVVVQGSVRSDRQGIKAARYIMRQIERLTRPCWSIRWRRSRRRSIALYKEYPRGEYPRGAAPAVLEELASIGVPTSS
jgi:hypothetical protein